MSPSENNLPRKEAQQYKPFEQIQAQGLLWEFYGIEYLFKG